MFFCPSFRHYFTLFFLLLPFGLLAQEFILSGRITDKADGEPLIGTNIVLRTGGSEEPAVVAVADAEGKFVLRLAANDGYTLSISFVGYQQQQRELSISKDMDLGTLSLDSDLKILEEVSVMAQRERVEVLGDTVQMNADAYQVMQGSVVEDMLKKMPGIVVQNGKVQAQGEEVKRILIDGRRFFEGDINAALKTLPAGMVDKIQVFDELSEQAQFSGFDDGNTTKTINIVTKPGMRNSLFGKGSAGMGPNGKYLAGGNLNLLEGERRLSLVGQSNNVNIQNFSQEDLVGATAGARGRGGSSAGNFQVGPQNGISSTNALGVNLHDQLGEKLKLTGSYFYNDSENVQTRRSSQQYNTEHKREYSEEQERVANNGYHHFNLRLEYDLNKYNSIAFYPSLNLQSSRFHSLENGSSLLGGELQNRIANRQTGESAGYRYNSKLVWKHRFEKAGRTLSWSLDARADDRTGRSTVSASTTSYPEAVSADSLDQLSLQESPGREVSSKLVYTEPLHPGGQWMLEYETSRQWDSSGKYTYDFEEGSQEYSLLDSALSNVFLNHYTTNSIGSGYRYRKKAWSATGGLSFQTGTLGNTQQFPFESGIDYTYNNLLGNTQLSYKAGGKRLTVSYRTNTSVPSVSQLQGVVNNSNPLQLRLGNPGLQQEYQHRLTSRFSTTLKEKTGTLMVYAAGNFTRDYVTTSTFFVENDTTIQEVRLPAGGQVSVPANLDGYRSFRSVVSYGGPVQTLGSNLNVNLSGNYSRVPGLVNGNQGFSHNKSLGMGVVLSSSFRQFFDFTLSSNSSFSRAASTLRAAQDRDYFNQSLNLDLNWLLLKNYIFRTNLNQQWYQGLSDGIGQQFILWNVSIGRKLFANRQGELNLFVYDLLGQNTSIARNVTEAFIQDVQTDVLQRYFMLRFTYSFRKALPGKGE